jgi:hypothetical protein
VEARKRVNMQGEEVFIVINHERSRKKVQLPWQAHDYINNVDTHELFLEPYGVAVLTHTGSK